MSAFPEFEEILLASAPTLVCILRRTIATRFDMEDDVASNTLHTLMNLSESSAEWMIELEISGVVPTLCAITSNIANRCEHKTLCERYMLDNDAFMTLRLLDRLLHSHSDSVVSDYIPLAPDVCLLTRSMWSADTRRAALCILLKLIRTEAMTPGVTRVIASALVADTPCIRSTAHSFLLDAWGMSECVRKLVRHGAASMMARMFAWNPGRTPSR
jgi:hypothetical protein